MPITLEFAHRVGGIHGKVPKGAKITDTICEPNPTRGISPCIGFIAPPPGYHPRVG